MAERPAIRIQNILIVDGIGRRQRRHLLLLHKLFWAWTD